MRTFWAVLWGLLAGVYLGSLIQFYQDLKEFKTTDQLRHQS